MQIKKLLSNFGIKLKLLKIQNGQKNIMNRPKKKIFRWKGYCKNEDGSLIQEKEVADAHPNGLRPFREQITLKFKTLTEGIITQSESKVSTLVQNLKTLNTEIYKLKSKN